MTKFFLSEVFEDFIYVRIPKVTEWIDSFSVLYDHGMVLHEGLVHDTFSHRHVNIHGSLHGGLLLKLYELVLVYTLLSLALATIGISACCVVYCASAASILIFFEEGHCDVPWVNTGLGTSLDNLCPIVAVVVDFSLVGDEGCSKLAFRSLIPIDALEDCMLTNLIQRGPKARVLHKDCL